MKVTGSHLIVQALRAEGIDQIFTLAGDHTPASDGRYGGGEL